MSDRYPVDHPIFASPTTMLEAVLRTCYTYPEKRNPVDGYGECVYDDGEGNHCLIGQMFVDFGLRVPRSNISICFILEQDGVPFIVAEKAGQAQALADDENGGLPTWAEVAETLRRREALNV